MDPLTVDWLDLICIDKEIAHRFTQIRKIDTDERTTRNRNHDRLTRFSPQRRRERKRGYRGKK